ncbi:hypothetical protein [Rubrobacter xylanophilus]|uniref:hypothetical protein n=1 Tax=Rubrobacter xylanophilus TaxID=49319 RepID=UPI00117B6030|nr:hypothetical protein [Rubrobacter xylanophilus]
MRELHTGLFILVWVLLVYLLAQTALTLVAGRVRRGRPQAALRRGGGGALFTVVSLLGRVRRRRRAAHRYSGAGNKHDDGRREPLGAVFSALRRQVRRINAGRALVYSGGRAAANMGASPR